jgi:hypothetical protein
MKVRGTALIPSQRRAQGATVAGAVLVKESSALLTLDASGALRMHSAAHALGRGALPVEQAVIALAAA